MAETPTTATQCGDCADEADRDPGLANAIALEPGFLKPAITIPAGVTAEVVYIDDIPYFNME